MSGYDDEAFCEKCLGLLTAIRVVEMPGGRGYIQLKVHWLGDV